MSEGSSIPVDMMMGHFSKQFKAIFRKKTRKAADEAIQELQNYGYVVKSSEERLYIPNEHYKEVLEVLADCECMVISSITKRI